MMECAPESGRYHSVYSVGGGGEGGTVSYTLLGSKLSLSLGGAELPSKLQLSMYCSCGITLGFFLFSLRVM